MMLAIWLLLMWQIESYLFAFYCGNSINLVPSFTKKQHFCGLWWFLMVNQEHDRWRKWKWRRRQRWTIFVITAQILYSVSCQTKEQNRKQEEEEEKKRWPNTYIIHFTIYFEKTAHHHHTIHRHLKNNFSLTVNKWKYHSCISNKKKHVYKHILREKQQKKK